MFATKGALIANDSQCYLQYLITDVRHTYDTLTPTQNDAQSDL